MQRAVSIDPGGTNGVAIWNYDKKSKVYKLEWVDGVEKHQLYDVLNETIFDIIIYEGYKLYSSHAKTMIGNEFETPQIIGVIKYLAEKRGVPVVEQMATTKKFFDDKRLKQMGLYVPIDHKRDAIRHFLYWVYFNKACGGKWGNQRELLDG